jgi:hypothetical protein
VKATQSLDDNNKSMASESYDTKEAEHLRKVVCQQILILL